MDAATPRTSAKPDARPVSDAGLASLVSQGGDAAPMAALRKEAPRPAEERAAREGRLSSGLAAGG